MKGNIAEKTCHAFCKVNSPTPKSLQIPLAFAAYSQELNKIRSSPPRSSIKSRMTWLWTGMRQSSPPYFSKSLYATLGATPDGLDLVRSRRMTWLLKRSFKLSSSLWITVDQSHRTSTLDQVSFGLRVIYGKTYSCTGSRGSYKLRPASQNTITLSPHSRRKRSHPRSMVVLCMLLTNACALRTATGIPGAKASLSNC